MALPPSYVPRDVPRSMPLPNPANPGRYIAEGLQRAGNVAVGVAQGEQETNARISEIQYQQQSRSEIVDAAARIAADQVDMQEKVLHLRETAAPGGAGHAEAVRKLYEERRDKLLQGVTTRAAQEYLINQLSTYGGTLVSTEQRWEAGQAAAKQGADADVAVKQGGLVVMRDPAQFRPQIEQLNATFDAMNFSADEADKLKRYGAQQLTKSMIEGRIATDPAKAAEIIDLPDIQTMLGDPDLVDRLRRVAVAQRDAAEATARAEAAVALKMQREQLATRRAELETGAGSPNDWMVLASQYEAMGDTSVAVQLRAKGTQMQAVQGSRDLSLPKMRARISELQAKPERSPAEASLLAGLQEQYRQSSERLNGSGGALAQYVYATGKTLPPINPAQPETLAARAQLAAAASARYGRPNIEPLLPDEVEGLRQLTEGGPEQRLQALTMLAGFGEPRAVYGAARQITNKDDGSFRVAAMRMNIPGGRQLASDILRGGEALKVLGKGWNQAGAMQTFQRYVGGALAGVGPQFAADTLEAAKAIYASTQQAAGKAEWDPKAFEASIERALGSYRDGQFSKGGSAVWKGFRVLVPPGWTGDGVFGRLQRITGEGLGGARVSGPGVWPDGSPLYTGQLRDGSLVPVLMTDTTYGFRAATTGRLLPSKSGGPFLLDMAKVPW